MNPSKKKKPLGRPVQQQDSPPTSQQILQTAALLFMEKGLEAVTMNQVAKYCGVTKATIYYYFPTKTDLFVASMVGTLVKVNERIRSMLELPGSFQSRLINITENYLKIPQMHMNGMYEQVKHHLTEEQQQLLMKTENGLYDALKAGFDAAVQEGEIACEDTLLTTYIYISMLRVGERQYGNEVLFSSERDAAEAIVAFLWRGIHA